MLERHEPRMYKALLLLFMGCGLPIAVTASEPTLNGLSWWSVLAGGACLILFSCVEACVLLPLEALRLQWAQAERTMLESKTLSPEDRAALGIGLNKVAGTTTIHQKEVQGVTLRYYYLKIPLAPHKMKNLAQALLAGAKFSEGYIVGLRGICTGEEFRTVQDIFLERKYAVWRKAGSPKQGAILTRSGEAAMRYIDLPTTKPSPEAVFKIEPLPYPPALSPTL